MAPAPPDPTIVQPQHDKRIRRAPAPTRADPETHDSHETRQDPAADEGQLKGSVPGPHPDRKGYQHVAEHEEARPDFTQNSPDVWTTLADFASIAVPLALMGVCAALMRKDGTEVSDGIFSNWKNTVTVLATLFPFVFSAIVGRLMVQAMRWKLEEGSSLGCLEQLLGSRTVGGALLTQINLQAFNLLGFSLLLLWAFSPLGSQAIARMLASNLDAVVAMSRVPYFNTEALPMFTELVANGLSTTYIEPNIEMFRTIYGATLLAPITDKNDTMDLWGHVKVPMLSSYGDSKTAEWQKVPPVLDMEYSSLVGIPNLNVTVGNTTFNMDSTYVELECDDMEVWSPERWKVDGETNSTALEGMRFSSLPPPVPNGTFQGFGMNSNSTSYAWSLAVDRLIDQEWLKTWARVYYANILADTENMMYSPAFFANETGIESGPTRLLFQANITEDVADRDKRLASHCSVLQKYVESRVTCSKPSTSSSQNCSVEAQRASQKTHAPESISHLSIAPTLHFVSKYLPLAGGKSFGNTSRVSDDDLLQHSENTLKFIANPSLVIKSGGVMKPGGAISSDPGPELRAMDGKTLSVRLSQVLNTYIHIGQVNWDMFMGNLGDGNTEIPEGTWPPPFPYNKTTDAEVKQNLVVYHIPKEWAAICILCCTVLLAAGVGSVAFAHLAVGPEVLGFASTALRDSKLFDLPHDTGSMKGTDITLSMKNLRVRYGFQEPRGDVDALLGVGAQDRTRRIKDVLGRDISRSTSSTVEP